MSYARHGANSGMVDWRCHRKEISIDSIMSDFSGIHLGHPGLGDKMFNNAVDYGALTLSRHHHWKSQANLMSAIVHPLILVPLLTMSRDLRKTHYLRKLIVSLLCHLTLYSVKIIISKMVCFLLINSDPFLYAVSKGFIAQ